MPKISDAQLKVLKAARDGYLESKVWAPGAEPYYLIRQPLRPSEANYGPRCTYPTKPTTNALIKRGWLEGVTLTEAGKKILEEA